MKQKDKEEIMSEVFGTLFIFVLVVVGIMVFLFMVHYIGYVQGTEQVLDTLDTACRLQYYEA